MFITKKKRIRELEAELENMRTINNELLVTNNTLSNELVEMKSKYPFEMGQTVYDLQLRSSKGRFTKTKASREHSLINEVVVDKKNYFNLVDRYTSNDVFTDRIEAEKYLESVCVE